MGLRHALQVDLKAKTFLQPRALNTRYALEQDETLYAGRAVGPHKRWLGVARGHAHMIESTVNNTEKLARM